MQLDTVPFARPWYGPEEVERVAAVIRSGWVSQGEQVEDFEQAVADFTGAAFAVAVSSATSALTLALRLQGIGPGDEVICPTFTCMATANAILALGARPIFADIDPATFNLAPASAEQALSPQTRALLGVDQVGLPADWDGLADVARRHGLAVVEDAACALGAEYRGNYVGALGWPTVLSFHPRKILSTGEGGMILLSDADQAARARRLRSHGAAISDRDRHLAGGTLTTGYPEPGYSFRMTDLQGALGVEQVKRLPWFLAERRRQARVYEQAFSSLAQVETPRIPAYCQHAFQSYLVRLRDRLGSQRDNVVKGLVCQGVACRVGIPALHLEPFFRDLYPGLRLPVAEAVAQDSLFLPIFPGLSGAEQQRVVDVLTDLMVGPAFWPPKRRPILSGL
jgi:dTDP-4-amino-4,6-dideoxygalactose transaminase